MAVDHDLLVEHLTRLQVRNQPDTPNSFLTCSQGIRSASWQCVIDRFEVVVLFKQLDELLVEIDRQDDGYAVLPGGEDRSRNAAAAASARRTPWAPHSRPMPTK
ncbi:MAG: hypothetical protein OXJ62_02155 [Spirochaetaceae bacterium]|nr:hypothetical protein [Spirochaetaceae bacterium]